MIRRPRLAWIRTVATLGVALLGAASFLRFSEDNAGEHRVAVGVLGVTALPIGPLADDGARFCAASRPRCAE